MHGDDGVEDGVGGRESSVGEADTQLVGRVRGGVLPERRCDERREQFDVGTHVLFV